MTDLSRASAPDDGVARRTILAGAAWSIPVIATAATAPVASASGALALAFDKPTYTGTACSPITGAYVTATNAGAPVADVLVGVSLPAGYTFSGGADSTSGKTGVDGRFTLPSITAPRAGGTGFMTASSSGASTSTSTVTAAATDGVPMNGTTPVTGLPSGVTATQITREEFSGSVAIWVLGSDNKLYYSLNGASLTTNAPYSNVKAGSLYASPGTNAVAWITTSGVPMDGATAITGLPAGVTATQITRQAFSGGVAIWVLASDNKLYYSLNGATLTANASYANAKAGSLYASAGTNAIVWITTSGVPMNGTTALTGLPAGVTATKVTRELRDGVTEKIWAIASNNVVYRNSGNKLTSDSGYTNATAGFLYAPRYEISIIWIRNGVLYNNFYPETGLPTGVTATEATYEMSQNSQSLVPHIWVVGSDKKLYLDNNGTVEKSSGPVRAGSLYGTARSDGIAWIADAACA